MDAKTIHRRILRSPMRSSYGEVILKKGTLLYHASKDTLCELPEKPVIFMTLHPSEWYYEDAYINIVELLQDVSLFFMVQDIAKLRIFSSLNTHIKKPGNNLAKMNYSNIKCWLSYLEAENFDGWFSSIENKTSIEFAIRNDPTIIKLISCSPISFNWNNSRYQNNRIIPKNWGKVYPIHTKEYPATLILNKRYEDQIDRYIEESKEYDPMGTAFLKLLEDATVYFIDTPFQPVYWCD